MILSEYFSLQSVWCFWQWDKILRWSFDVFWQWGEVNGREDCDQINVKQGNYDVVDFDLGDEDYADKDDEDVDNDADDVDDDDLGPGCPH